MRRIVIVNRGRLSRPLQVIWRQDKHLPIARLCQMTVFPRDRLSLSLSLSLSLCLSLSLSVSPHVLCCAALDSEEISDEETSAERLLVSLSHVELVASLFDYKRYEDAFDECGRGYSRLLSLSRPR